MANVLFGYPIVSDVGSVYTPSLSGGSWLAGLGLTNMQNRYLHRVARSTTDAIADTVFTCDLGAALPVRVVSLVNHNISAAGTVRVVGWSGSPALESIDFNAGWTLGGVTVTDNNVANQNDVSCFDTLTSAGGVASENASRTVTFAASGERAITIELKAGTSTQTDVNLRDNTAAVSRHIINVAWSGGVPTVTSQSGSGSILETTALGNGVYRITFTATGVVHTNTNQVIVYPTGTGTAAGTVAAGAVYAWDAATSGLAYDSGRAYALPSDTDADDRDGWMAQTTYVTDTDATARYWRINISDTSNPDGYVDIGRLIIASGIQPSVNASLGATLGWTTSSTREESDGGAFIHNTRARRREARILLDVQSEAEAFGDLWLMQQRAGTTGQVFFVLDADDDATLLWKRSFLGVLRELSPVEFSKPLYHATPYAVTEELG